MRITDRQFGAILSLPSFVAILALVFLPMILLFVTATLSYVPGRPRVFVGLDNFTAILDDRLFWLALKNTVLYSAGVVSLTLCVGLPLALSLSRLSRGNAIFRTLALLPWAVPLVVSAMIWAWVFNPSVGIFSDLLMKFRLLDEPLPILSNRHLAMIAVIVADAWTRIPFLTVFVLAGIEQIPEELYAAARVDGADQISTFRYITLPLVKGPLLVALLIISMFSFRALDVIFMMTEGGPARATYTLAYYLPDQLWLKANFGTGSATGVLLLVLIAGFASLYIYNIRKTTTTW